MEDVIDLYFSAVAKEANAKVFSLHLDLGGAESMKAARGDTSSNSAAPVGVKGRWLRSEEVRSNTKAYARTVFSQLSDSAISCLPSLRQKCVRRKDGVPAVSVFKPDQLRPTTITVKLPGTMAGRGRGFSGVGAGRGPNSAETR